MNRAQLKRFLEEGLSLAEIGRRLGRHESTVAYWMAKHGFEANGRERHAAKEAISRERLEELVDDGLSTAQIGGVLGRAPATIRRWLRKYGLQTRWAERRQASKEGRRELTLACARHGLTTFRLRRNAGYRCATCKCDAFSKRRRNVKRILVEEAGGACRLCGYSRCMAALEFHHVVPADKRFALSRRGVTRSIERARAEAQKCVLLCANCHAEVEAGVATLTEPDRPTVQ